MNLGLIKQFEKFGEEYNAALESVLEIREARLAEYGNTFMEDELLFLRFQLKNKMKRFDLQVELDDQNLDIKIKEGHEEKALDSLKDLVNYGLFLIAKIQNK